jgi:hypothetical protein
MEKKYRKPDQDYIDEYDRQTIRLLKELEQKATKPLMTEEMHYPYLIVAPHYDPTTEFYNTAVLRAQNKNECIADQKRRDEQKDHIVSQHLPLDHVRCNTCNNTMSFYDYWFKENENPPVLFIYNCLNKKCRNKVLYPSGREYIISRSKCEKCGGELKSSSKKTKRLLVLTDTCKRCGDKKVSEFDLSILIDEPITEEDRKKYCTDFIGHNTFLEDLEKIAELGKRLERYSEEKKTRDESGIDKVVVLNIVQIEEKLIKATLEKGFRRFEFDKPKDGGFILVSFSAQDKINREEKQSIKLLKKVIQESVFPTNWRLVSDSLSFSLGILTGRLKGYKLEPDLMKIGREILSKP